MSASARVRPVERAFWDELSKIGFSIKYGIATIPIEKDWLGWVGLNIGTHKEFLRVNPNIGVHSIAIMKITAEIRGERYQAGSSPTLSNPLGRIRPNDEQFIIRASSDVIPEAQRLCAIVRTDGIEYMKSMADYEVLATELSKEADSLGMAPLYCAAAFYLCGKTAQGNDVVEKFKAVYSRHGLELEAARLAALRGRFE